MEIENTGWKSFAEENKTVGGLTFGYKAPANKKVLQELPLASMLFEVRNSDGSFCRLVNLKNKDKEHFAEGQYLAILDLMPIVGVVNENFKAFETTLEKKMNKPLPDDRFDSFVDWTNPGAWKKKKSGYSLDVSHLSSEKREGLIADFATNGGSVKKGQLSVSDPKWIKVLEFEWEMAREQKLSRVQAKRVSSR